jgi:hypothetical protein
VRILGVLPNTRSTSLLATISVVFIVEAVYMASFAI